MRASLIIRKYASILIRIFFLFVQTAYRHAILYRIEYEKVSSVESNFTIVITIFIVLYEMAIAEDSLIVYAGFLYMKWMKFIFTLIVG